MTDSCQGKIILDGEKLLSCHPEVKIELIRRCLEAVNCGQRDITQGHFESVIRLAEQKITGKKIELPGGFLATFEYGKLIFNKTENKPQPQLETAVKLNIPGKTATGRLLIEAEVLQADRSDVEKFKRTKDEFVEWFDLDRIEEPLTIRSRKQGDRFIPLGLKADKNAGDFLTDAKIPHQLRGEMLVVEDVGKIIWLWPFRIAEPAKITDRTQKILQMKITNNTKSS